MSLKKAIERHPWIIPVAMLLLVWLVGCVADRNPSPEYGIETTQNGISFVADGAEIMMIQYDLNTETVKIQLPANVTADDASEAIIQAVNAAWDYHEKPERLVK